jgi:hypothetical protein
MPLFELAAVEIATLIAEEEAAALATAAAESAAEAAVNEAGAQQVAQQGIMQAGAGAGAGAAQAGVDVNAGVSEGITGVEPAQPLPQAGPNPQLKPIDPMFEEMQRQMAQDKTNPFQGERLGDLADWDSGVNPVGDAVKSPLSEVVNKATSPTIDPLDPFGGFPSSGPTPPPASTESAANVINQGMQQPVSPFMDAYNTASEYVEANKFKTGLGVYGLLSATGQLQNKGNAPPPKNTFNNPYHFSSSFQGTHPDPTMYQTKSNYPSYAMGGITSVPPRTNFANPSQSMMGTSQYSMATDPMSGNIANRMAEGGVTGGGQMQLNVPINIGEGSGGTGGFGGGGGYGGYTSGAGYAPPGGPQGGSAGSLASLGRVGLQGQPSAGAAPQAQGAQGPQMNMQEKSQAQGTSNDVNGFTPIQTNQGTLLAGQFLQGLSGIPQDQKARGAMGAMPLGMQQGQAMQQEQNPMQMARGGITDVPRYKKGGDMDVYDASLRFADMMDNPSRYTPPDTRFYSVDTFRDTNPNTANKLADEAAETRRKAIEQRSYVNTGAKYLPSSRRPGQLDLGPVGGERGKYDNQESILAAQGGIMGYNLGGYANGGNPRLLRGPGDGMSDNIPATISDKQPARLADGEFVVPADVVSHLGNGSTEAGAKKLHEMMNSVRKARTGNPKQGKKINPNKFMPKK